MNSQLNPDQIKVLNLTKSVISEVKKVIIGKDEIIGKVLLSILAGGHILIEDIPGVGVIENLADWKTKMKSLFAQLVPLGFDGATKDPVRLSRLPGIWRNDTNKFQQLLFLNQNGGIHV